MYCTENILNYTIFPNYPVVIESSSSLHYTLSCWFVHFPPPFVLKDSPSSTSSHLFDVHYFLPEGRSIHYFKFANSTAAFAQLVHLIVAFVTFTHNKARFRGSRCETLSFAHSNSFHWGLVEFPNFTRLFIFRPSFLFKQNRNNNLIVRRLPPGVPLFRRGPGWFERDCARGLRTESSVGYFLQCRPRLLLLLLPLLIFLFDIPIYL